MLLRKYAANIEPADQCAQVSLGSQPSKNPTPALAQTAPVIRANRQQRKSQPNDAITDVVLLRKDRMLEARVTVVERIYQSPLYGWPHYIQNGGLTYCCCSIKRAIVDCLAGAAFGVGFAKSVGWV